MAFIGKEGFPKPISVDTKLLYKADLVDGKVPDSQLPVISGGAIGNLDGGQPDSDYGGVDNIDSGDP